MRFQPDYQLHIASEETFPQDMCKIQDQLAAYRQEGEFPSFDSGVLYYEYYLAENSRASIVLVHGLSEFTQKYHELTYYLLNQGYNVFLYDQRCHGRSFRLTDRVEMVHVDRFTDYAKDLDQFIRLVVQPAAEKPIYLYAHSMGGAVSLLYLSKCSGTVQKAVLSAPLFAPVVTAVPEKVALLGVSIMSVLVGPKRKFWGSREFDPDIGFEASADASRARFQHNMALRKGDVRYSSTPLTLGWIRGSLTVQHKLLSHRLLRKLHTPILLLSAANDTVVRNDLQHRFAEKYPLCRLVSIPGTDHPMLTSTPQTIRQHLELVLDYFQG